MDISFFNETSFNTLDFEEKIRDLLKSENNNYNMSIIFIDDNKMQELNLMCRNIDKTTDVLSFAYFDNNYEFDSKDELGDIFISIPRAIEQANQFKHSLLREVCFLAIHGYLHLLGYDHNTKEEEEEMFSLQEEILKKGEVFR